MEPLKPSRSAASPAAVPAAAVEQGHAPERAPSTTARSAGTQNVVPTHPIKNATPASAGTRTPATPMQGATVTQQQDTAPQPSTQARPLTSAANRPPPKPAAQQPTPSSLATADSKPTSAVEPAVAKQTVPRPKLATPSGASGATGAGSRQMPVRPQSGATAAELTATPNAARKLGAEVPRPQTTSTTTAAAASIQAPRPQTTNTTTAAAASIQAPRPQTTNTTTAAAASIQAPRPQTTNTTTAAAASIARKPSSQLGTASAAFPRTKASSSAELTIGLTADTKPSAFEAAAAAFPHTEASSSIDVTDSMLLHSRPSAVDVTDSMLVNSKPSSPDAADAEFSHAEPASSIDVTDAMIVSTKPSCAGAVPSRPFPELQSDEELAMANEQKAVNDQASALLEDPAPVALPSVPARSDAPGFAGAFIESDSMASPRAGQTEGVATQAPSVTRASDHELTPSASAFAPRDLTEQSKRLVGSPKRGLALRVAMVAGVVSFGGLVGLFVYSRTSEHDSASSTQVAVTPSKPDVRVSPPAEPPTPRPADVTAPQRPNQETPKPVAPEVTPVAPSAASSPKAVADATLKSSSVDSLTIPDYVNKPALLFVSDVAVRRSQRCHPQGHAVGTAQLFVTFSPNGRVNAARLEGEPLASAPVAKCIVSHARAIQMPKFKGPSFTHVISVTLR